MPAEERVGLDDQEGLFPIEDAAGEEEGPEAITSAQPGPLDLTLKDKQLMAKESIFSEELCSAEWKVGESTGDEGNMGRGDHATEELFQPG